MAGRGLGSLTVDLLLRIGGFEQGMDRAARAIARAQERLKSFAKEGERITASVATPFEIYRKQIALLNTALKTVIDSTGTTAISTETWARAVKAATRELDAANPAMQRWNALVAEGKKLTAEHIAPLDAFRARFKELTQLALAGQITPEIRTAELKKAKAVLDATNPALVAQGEAFRKAAQLADSARTPLERYLDKIREIAAARIAAPELITNRIRDRLSGQARAAFQQEDPRAQARNAELQRRDQIVQANITTLERLQAELRDVQALEKAGDLQGQDLARTYARLNREIAAATPAIQAQARAFEEAKRLVASVQTPLDIYAARIREIAAAKIAAPKLVTPDVETRLFAEADALLARLNGTTAENNRLEAEAARIKQGLVTPQQEYNAGLVKAIEARQRGKISQAELNAEEARLKGILDATNPALQAQAQALERAKRIAEASRTPLEIYRAKVKEINDLARAFPKEITPRIRTESIRLAREELKRLTAQANQSANAFGHLGTRLRLAVSGFVGIQGVRGVLSLADQYQTLANRLRVVTNGSAELAAAQQTVFDISQQTRTSLQGTTELYSRLSRSTEQLGITQREVADLTEYISKAIVASGASAQEATNGIIQFSQGLASSRLSGDELRAVLEQLPGLSKPLAAGLGVAIGNLRELGREGQLTPERIIKALQAQFGNIERLFQQTTVTISGAFTRLRNATLQAVGGANMQPLVDSINELTKTITDPAFQQGIATLAAALLRISALTFEGFAMFARGVTNLGEFVGRFDFGPDDPKAILQEQLKANETYVNKIRAWNRQLTDEQIASADARFANALRNIEIEREGIRQLTVDYAEKSKTEDAAAKAALPPSGVGFDASGLVGAANDAKNKAESARESILNLIGDLRQQIVTLGQTETATLAYRIAFGDLAEEFRSAGPSFTRFKKELIEISRVLGQLQATDELKQAADAAEQEVIELQALRIEQEQGAAAALEWRRQHGEMAKTIAIARGEVDEFGTALSDASKTTQAFTPAQFTQALEQQSRAIAEQTAALQKRKQAAEKPVKVKFELQPIPADLLSLDQLAEGITKIKPKVETVIFEASRKVAETKVAIKPTVEVAQTELNKVKDQIEGVTTGLNIPALKVPVKLVDPAGFPIDLSRPRLRNLDGTVSTEETTTVTSAQLEIKFEDKFYNIPTIVDGVRVKLEAAIADAKRRMAEGVKLPNFDTLEEAKRQAPLRSEAIGKALEAEAAAVRGLAVDYGVLAAQTKIAADAAQARETAAKIAKERLEAIGAIEDLIKSTKAETSSFIANQIAMEQGAVAALRYRIAHGDLKPTFDKARDAAAGLQTELEKVIKAQEALTDRADAIAASEKLIPSRRKAAEDYMEVLEGLEIRLATGEIVQEEYNEAVKQAEKNFKDATKVVTEWSVFMDEAARAAQDALSEFLFDPFAEGLDGMVSGFAEALRKIAAEIVAAKLAENLFEDMEQGISGFGGNFVDRLKEMFGFGAEEILSPVAVTAQRLPEQTTASIEDLAAIVDGSAAASAAAAQLAAAGSTVASSAAAITTGATALGTAGTTVATGATAVSGGATALGTAAASLLAAAQAISAAASQLAAAGSVVTGTSVAGLAGRGIGPYAKGGKVFGPGTGTSDSVPAMLSAGEFVVRAAAVRNPEILALLERINASNGVLKLASGGKVEAPAGVKTVRAAAKALPEPQNLAYSIQRTLEEALARSTSLTTSRDDTARQLREVVSRSVQDVQRHELNSAQLLRASLERSMQEVSRHEKVVSLDTARKARETVTRSLSESRHVKDTLDTNHTSDNRLTEGLDRRSSFDTSLTETRELATSVRDCLERQVRTSSDTRHFRRTDERGQFTSDEVRQIRESIRNSVSDVESHARQTRETFNTRQDLRATEEMRASLDSRLSLSDVETRSRQIKDSLDTHHSARSDLSDSLIETHELATARRVRDHLERQVRTSSDTRHFDRTDDVTAHREWFTLDDMRQVRESIRASISEVESRSRQARETLDTRHADNLRGTLSTTEEIRASLNTAVSLSDVETRSRQVKDTLQRLAHLESSNESYLTTSVSDRLDRSLKDRRELTTARHLQDFTSLDTVSETRDTVDWSVRDRLERLARVAVAEETSKAFHATRAVRESLDRSLTESRELATARQVRDSVSRALQDVIHLDTNVRETADRSLSDRTVLERRVASRQDLQLLAHLSTDERHLDETHSLSELVRRAPQQLAEPASVKSVLENQTKALHKTLTRDRILRDASYITVDETSTVQGFKRWVEEVAFRSTKGTTDLREATQIRALHTEDVPEALLQTKVKDLRETVRRTTDEQITPVGHLKRAVEKVVETFRRADTNSESTEIARHLIEQTEPVRRAVTPVAKAIQSEQKTLTVENLSDLTARDVLRERQVDAYRDHVREAQRLRALESTVLSTHAEEIARYTLQDRLTDSRGSDRATETRLFDSARRTATLTELLKSSTVENLTDRDVARERHTDRLSISLEAYRDHIREAERLRASIRETERLRESTVLHTHDSAEESFRWQSDTQTTRRLLDSARTATLTELLKSSTVEKSTEGNTSAERLTERLRELQAETARVSNLTSVHEVTRIYDVLQRQLSGRGVLKGYATGGLLNMLKGFGASLMPGDMPDMGLPGVWGQLKKLLPLLMMLLGKGGLGGLFRASGGPVDVRPGGMLHGPGTPTSDDMLLWGSTNEFMIRAKAVQQPGALAFLDAFNRGRISMAQVREGLEVKLPKLAMGGPATPMPPPLALAAGGIVPALSEVQGGRTLIVHQNFAIDAPRGSVSTQTQMQITAAAARGARMADRRNN